MGMTQFHGPPAVPPVVPGFAPATLLGAGGHGVVWAAREQISGELVALKIGSARMHAQGDTASHEADLLARLDHPHVVRLRRVVQAGDGSTVLVLDLAAGGSLAALVAARGPLEPGEVVTLIVPLATALSDLHAQGLVHGDLSPGNVLFSGEGRPLIADLGVGSVLGSRAGKQWSTPGFADPGRHDDPPAADVWGLGAIAWFALTGQPPQPGSMAPDGVDELRDLIGECLDPDPQRRPAMDDIALRAWDAAAPAPIRFSSAGPPSDSWLDAAAEPLWPAPDPALRLATMPSADGAAAVAAGTAAASGRRRVGRGVRSGVWPRGRRVTSTGLGRPGLQRTPARGSWIGRRGLVAGVSLAAVAALVVYLIMSNPARPAPVAPKVPAAVTVSVTNADLAGALTSIAAARAQAFRTVSVTPLARADEPGSDADQQDQALVRRLQQAGLRLDGVSYRITDVHLAGPMGAVVDVDAVVTTSAHRQVPTTTRATAQDVVASGPAAVRLRLVRTANGWLVRSVQPGVSS